MVINLPRLKGWLAGLLLMTLSATAQAMAPIQHWSLENGARVYFVPAAELPMVDVRVTFDAGSARDAGRAGLAQLTNELLGKGAGGASADAIAAAFEDRGAQFGSGALRDMAWVSLRSLSDPVLLQPALAVLAKVLAQPDFNATDFERERRRMRVSVQQRAQDPGAIAEEAFYRAMYGSHPYASPPGGTEQSLKSLSREQIKAFHQRYYVGRNAVVAIVGDLDRGGAERLAKQVAGGLPAGEAPAALPEVPALAGSTEQRIVHPSSQTHLRMGMPGMTRTDPDYFALYVGNHSLGGGGFTSRFYEEIREKRGLSYSVYSYFLPMGRKGPFMMGLQTRNDQLDEALSVLRDTVSRYLAEGPTDAELASAKKNITGGYALRIDSNSKIVEYLGLIGFYGLPLDYLETFNAHVEAVTAEQIRDALQRRVDAGRMVTVIVGGEPAPTTEADDG